MNVCFVMNDFKSGGAERLVKDLAVETDDLNELNAIIVVANPEGKLKREFLSSDVEIVPLGIDVVPSAIPTGVRELVTKLQYRDVDIVHSHLAFSDLISRIACAWLSVPHISTYHNVQRERSLPKRAIERVTRRLSDRIVCVSDGVRRSYGDQPEMQVIYNAIDVNDFSCRVSRAHTSQLSEDIRAAQTVYLNVARCVDVKRQHDLIAAIDHLDASDAHLVIVGDGPRKPALERAVAERELSDQVTITGYVEHIEPYYAIADAFVSSSAKEGLPTTHIEAMAARLPIVSTDIPGVREIVEHGEQGYLCPVGDPKTLAAFMRRLHITGDEAFGERGYKTAINRFSIETMIEKHIELYSDLYRE